MLKHVRLFGGVVELPKDGLICIETANRFSVTMTDGKDETRTVSTPNRIPAFHVWSNTSAYVGVAYIRKHGKRRRENESRRRNRVQPQNSRKTG